MKPSDFDQIERELGITLPQSYKDALHPFRIPALIGNTDNLLWDDAEKLIALNLDLRAGKKNLQAWPPHFFALGDPHGDEMVALDLREPVGPVWWMDHGIVDHKNSYRSHATFTEWAEEFYADTRRDLEDFGYAPDGSPEQLSVDNRKASVESLYGCLVLLLLAAAVIAAVAYIRSR